MKQKFQVLALIILGLAVLSINISPAQAQESENSTEPENGSVVCTPDAYYPDFPDDCLALGPSTYITALAEQGIRLPIPPLLYEAPSYELNLVPFSYFKLDATGSALYPSLDAAINRSGANQILAAGFSYVTYIERRDTGSGVYYQHPSGQWMPGDGSRVSPPTFQGIQLQATPRSAFGWVLGEATVWKNPNYYYNNLAIRTVRRFDIVQIYNTKIVDSYEWFQVGPEEWIEARMVAAVTPKTTPPEGVTSGRWLEVNLAEQTMAVYENHQMVFATLISSGVEPYWTQPGLFQIYMKKDTEDMSGAFEADRSDYYYLESVPWTMYFDKARAIHGAYWHTFFGYSRSHGCVNLSLGDANWVYQWANEGDWVWVHDPTGRTPTDAELYGDGGA